jgi:hypothetical protein
MLSLHLLPRLIEYIFNEGKLYLVFEYVDKDLKKYMVATDGPLKPALIKVTTDHVFMTENDICCSVVRPSASSWNRILPSSRCYAQV